jgi:DNA-binding Lrp family transcriptional regulator
MKDVELKLISELMKNARKSDRELAVAIGVSQPRVSRMIKKLEKEGIIKEFTMIPDFAKLGYELMSLTFIKLKDWPNPDEVKPLRNTISQELHKDIFPDLLNDRGLGLDSDGIIITLHRSYSDYTKQMDHTRSRPFVKTDHIESSLIDLKDPFHHRSLTLSLVARAR